MKNVLFFLIFGFMILNVKAEKSFDEMISLHSMALGSNQQNIHGWSKDPDDVWRYHFDLNRTTDLTFDMSLGLKRSSSSDNFIDAKVYVVLSHPTDPTGHWVISEETIFTPLDWTAAGASGNFSRNHLVQVTIPHQLFTSGNFPENYRISVIIEGKRLTDNFASYKNYFQERYHEYILKPIIKGASSICNEEMYRISYASSVALENATGLANLTDMGGGSYKISRTGSATGSATIVAYDKNSNRIEKGVFLGIPKPISITGGRSGNLNWSSTYTYEVETEDINDVLEIEKLGTPSIIFTRISNNKFTIKTPAYTPNPNIPIQKILVFSIRARVVKECGNSEYIDRDIYVGTGRLE